MKVGIALLVAFHIILSLATGWVFMLAIEAIHNGWWNTVPTIGYWWAVLVTLLLRAAFYQVSTDSK